MSLTIDLSISLIRGSIKYSVLIAVITGTIYYYKYKHTYLKYFLLLLWYIAFTEFFGDYILNNDILIYTDENGKKYNLWIVNLLYTIFFPVIFYIYLKEIKNNKYRLWIKIFLIGYLIISVMNWYILQNFLTEWSELPFIIGSFSTMVTIIFYFIELLKSDKVAIFHRTLLFWISVGLLLFHAGSIPFTIKINGYALIPGTHQLFLIMYVLAIIMYSTFTFGFIWSKKE